MTFYFKPYDHIFGMQYKLVANKGSEPASGLGNRHDYWEICKLVQAGHKVVLDPTIGKEHAAEPGQMHYAKGYRGPFRQKTGFTVTLIPPTITTSSLSWPILPTRCQEDVTSTGLDPDAEYALKPEKPEIGPLPPQAPLAPQVPDGTMLNPAEVTTVPVTLGSYVTYYSYGAGEVEDAVEKFENALEYTKPSLWQRFRNWAAHY